MTALRRVALHRLELVPVILSMRWAAEMTRNPSRTVECADHVLAVLIGTRRVFNALVRSVGYFDHAVR